MRIVINRSKSHKTITRMFFSVLYIVWGWGDVRHQGCREMRLGVRVCVSKSPKSERGKRKWDRLRHSASRGTFHRFSYYGPVVFFFYNRFSQLVTMLFMNGQPHLTDFHKPWSCEQLRVTVYIVCMSVRYFHSMITAGKTLWSVI